MSSDIKFSWLSPVMKAATGVTIAATTTLILGTAPADANIGIAKADISTRLLNVGRDINSLEATSKDSKSKDEIAQWYNQWGNYFTNWNSWNNWGNWHSGWTSSW